MIAWLRAAAAANPIAALFLVLAGLVALCFLWEWVCKWHRRVPVQDAGDGVESGV